MAEASAPAPAAPPSTRHPLVEKILGGSAPEAIRMTAARGALPIPMNDLLYLQICLLQDEDPGIAAAAAESLERVDSDAILPLLHDPACDPLILDHFARSGRLTGAALEASVAHPLLTDAALESLAASGDEMLLNLIVTNEVRLIKTPGLLDVLRANPNLSSDNRRRLGELERDFLGKEPLQFRPARPEPPLDPDAVPEISPEAPSDEPITEEQLAQEPAELDAEYFEEEERTTPVFQKIMKMNVSERVQLAMKGGAEERKILVRDTARLVSRQVLKSPKVSENEITVFAGMRNVHEDILREIAKRRDWTKSYAVAHALVRNPKTPAGVSLQFLPRLGTRDLKIVAGDKNVPELVRRNARTMFLVRTQPPKKGKKAH